MGKPELPSGRTIGPFGRSRLTERPSVPKTRSRERKGFSRTSFCSGPAGGQEAVAGGVAAVVGTGRGRGRLGLRRPGVSPDPRGGGVGRGGARGGRTPPPPD